MADKSLQINVSSVEDAKAVVQNLKAIQQAYDAHGCSSVEFQIMEEVVTPTAKYLVGIIPWCTAFRKIIKPLGDNVLFQLPHYRELTAARPVPASEPSPAEQKQPNPEYVAPDFDSMQNVDSIPARPQKKKPTASPSPLVQAIVDTP